MNSVLKGADHAGLLAGCHYTPQGPRQTHVLLESCSLNLEIFCWKRWADAETVTFDSTQISVQQCVEYLWESSYAPHCVSDLAHEPLVHRPLVLSLQFIIVRTFQSYNKSDTKMYLIKNVDSNNIARTHNMNYKTHLTKHRRSNYILQFQKQILIMLKSKHLSGKHTGEVFIKSAPYSDTYIGSKCTGLFPMFGFKQPSTYSS